MIDSPGAALDLQRAAGNQAVVALLDVRGGQGVPPSDGPGRASRTAQRQPTWSGADVRPAQAPDDGSYVDPKRLEQGWNTGPALVQDTWRVPVDGLSKGTDTPWTADEKNKTAEPAVKRAILLHHRHLDAGYPVSVVLHLHGWSHRAGVDPYAGWRQAQDDPTKKDPKRPPPPAGTVRDVHHDRIVAQVDQVAHELKDPQLVVILPQGTGKSDFGGIERDVNGYVSEVLHRAVDMSAGTRSPLRWVPPEWSLVASAHSGGGDRLATTMAQDRSGTLKGAPLSEVILFDAIHVSGKWDGVAEVVAWVEHHLKRVEKRLKGVTDPAARAAAVASCPILRAYASKDYWRNYERLAKLLNATLEAYGSRLGDQKAAVTARFTVEFLADAGHEQIVRGLDDDPAGGPLADALRARVDPTQASRVTGAKRLSPAPAPAPGSGAVQRQPARGRQRPPVSDRALAQATTQGDQADRDAVAGALRNSGHPNPATWFADIVEGTFLGQTITASTGTVPGVHRRLLDRLQRAERTLLARTEYQGLDAATVGQRLNMYSVSGLRKPMAASGGELPSMHCFGLAVDVNYDGSPFVGLQQARVNQPRFVSSRTPRVIERAMWLMRGQAFNVESGREANVTRAWQAHRDASDALVEYLALSQDPDPARQRLRSIVARAGQPAAGVGWNQPDTDRWWNDVAWWQQRLAVDWSVRNLYDFHAAGHHGKAETTGYMDLHQHLVEALDGAGLAWGGQYQGAKDIMHFGLDGVIQR